MTNDFSGGLRGLRPPATIWHPFGVRFVSSHFRWSPRTPTTGYFLAPLQGAIMTNDFSGGLRGLRPPATFFATLRVGEVSQRCSYHQEASDRSKGCSITQL